MVEYTFKILLRRLPCTGKSAVVALTAVLSKPGGPFQRAEAMSQEGAPVRDVAEALELRGVSKWFGKGDGRTVALRDVNLDMHGGEFLSIVGPSGCGKSTWDSAFRDHAD